ncbi:MAG: hypothetical protein HQM08_30955 [Candidatus Riflebacteria bacterium]|nr:hypothetical protein [Candidatus Riflebacteria bacterium]
MSAKEDSDIVLVDETIASVIGGDGDLESGQFLKKHPTGKVKGKKREVKIFRVIDFPKVAVPSE